LIASIKKFVQRPCSELALLFATACFAYSVEMRRTQSRYYLMGIGFIREAVNFDLLLSTTVGGIAPLTHPSLIILLLVDMSSSVARFTKCLA
jgi:hypothetical protein